MSTTGRIDVQLGVPQQRPIEPTAGPAPAPVVAPAWRRFGPLAMLGLLLQTRLAWLGLLVVASMLMLALTADLLTPYDPDYQSYTRVLEAPSLDHPFGTD